MIPANGLLLMDSKTCVELGVSPPKGGADERQLRCILGLQLERPLRRQCPATVSPEGIINSFFGDASNGIGGEDCADPIQCGISSL